MKNDRALAARPPGAEGGTRTPTRVISLRPERSASANSATSAWRNNYIRASRHGRRFAVAVPILVGTGDGSQEGNRGPDRGRIDFQLPGEPGRHSRRYVIR